MEVTKEENKSMYQILITTICRGEISTTIAKVHTEKEANEMVERVENMKPREMFMHYADRLN